jgi:hypothetical protein
LYFFSVNKEYANNREQTRFILNKNIRSKHSYFCKVEWKFFNAGHGAGGWGKSVYYPDKEEAITASQKLLSVILPILEKEHWPI